MDTKGDGDVSKNPLCQGLLSQVFILDSRLRQVCDPVSSGYAMEKCRESSGAGGSKGDRPLKAGG